MFSFIYGHFLHKACLDAQRTATMSTHHIHPFAITTDLNRDGSAGLTRLQDGMGGQVTIALPCHKDQVELAVAIRTLLMGQGVVKANSGPSVGIPDGPWIERAAIDCANQCDRRGKSHISTAVCDFITIIRRHLPKPTPDISTSYRLAVELDRVRRQTEEFDSKLDAEKRTHLKREAQLLAELAEARSIITSRREQLNSLK